MNTHRHAGGASFRGDPEMMKRIDINVGGDLNYIGSAGSGHVNFHTKNAEDMLLEGQDMGALVKFGLGTNGNSKYHTMAAYAKKSRFGLLAQTTTRSANDIDSPYESLSVDDNYQYYFGAEPATAEQHKTALRRNATKKVTNNYKIENTKYSYKQHLIKGSVDLNSGDKAQAGYTQFVIDELVTSGGRRKDKEYTINAITKSDVQNVKYIANGLGALGKTTFSVGYALNEVQNTLKTDRLRKDEWRKIDGSGSTDDESEADSIGGYEKMINKVASAGALNSVKNDKTTMIALNTSIRGISVGLARINLKSNDQSSDYSTSTTDGAGNISYIATAKNVTNQMTLMGGYISKEFKYGKTKITPSMKHETAKYSSDELDEGSSHDPAEFKKEQDVTKKGTSYGVNINHEINNNITVFADYRHLITMPQASVIYSSDSWWGDYDYRQYQKSSRDLKPTENNIISAGLGYSSPYKVMGLDGRLSFKAEAWQNTLKNDHIFENGVAHGSKRNAELLAISKGLYNNGGGKTLKGLDLLAKYNWDNNALETRLSYSTGVWNQGYTKNAEKTVVAAKVKAMVHIFDGDKYAGVAPLTLNTTYSKDFSSGDKFEWNVFARAKFTHTPRDQDQLHRGAYILNNMYYTWRIKKQKHAYVRLAIDNIFDRAYVEGNEEERLYSGKGRDIRIEFIKKF